MDTTKLVASLANRERRLREVRYALRQLVHESIPVGEKQGDRCPCGRCHALRVLAAEDAEVASDGGGET